MVKRVRGSSTGRPIMALLDLWAGAGRCASSGNCATSLAASASLQDSIGASPTIINTRLAELREAKLVELDEAVGYRLTPLGQELLRLFLPLHLWSEKWAKSSR